MAVLKIYNDIQTENEQKMCQFWGDAEGITFKDVDEFVNSIPADDNEIEIRLPRGGGSVLGGRPRCVQPERIFQPSLRVTLPRWQPLF